MGVNCWGCRTGKLPNTDILNQKKPPFRSSADEATLRVCSRLSEQWRLKLLTEDFPSICEISRL